MYKPSNEIFEKYAQVLARYSLGGGRGIKQGDTVLVYANECAKPLLMAVHKEIVRMGGHMLLQYHPDEFDRYGLNRTTLEYGTNKQLDFFPEVLNRRLVQTIDHHLLIMSTPITNLLSGIPSDRIERMKKQSMRFYGMRTEKENTGKVSWCMCLYGTAAAAKVVGLTLEQYWDQIIKACYLNLKNPVAKWQKTQLEMWEFRDRLNALDIQKVHVTGPNVDLHITIGNRRKFLTGSGRNMPSFEIYTSPDWRGTNGWIRFNQPLYYLGMRISGIELYFKDGIVTDMRATENLAALKEMLSLPNANKIGEFSLTDSRHSNITHPMGITLYDENLGGKQGNMHIAMGNSYPTTFAGTTTLLTPALKKKLGFNVCPSLHVDIITTDRRQVMATLKNGDEMLIYKDGKFLI